MSEKLNIAVAGIGNVGSNFLKIFEEHQEKISQLANKEIKITTIIEKKPLKNICNIDKYRVYNDLDAILKDDDIDIVVELIGGTGDFLLEFLQKCLKNKKHVVTANKAMIATKGMKIIETAISNERRLRYEAAVLGTVPVILPLTSSALPLRPVSVLGIFNGTCNYILTQMAKTKNSFSEILAHAQKLGIAELNPSLDIDGYDTAHKLTILSSIVFNTKLDFNSVNIKGIKHIKTLDVEIVKKLDFTIKLLARAQIKDGKIITIVAPSLINSAHSLAQIDGTINALQINDEISGPVLLSGHGAGGKQTANAVISDVISIAQGTNCNILRNKFSELKTIQPYDISLLESRYYLRFMIKDKSDMHKIEQLLLKEKLVLQYSATHQDEQTNKIALVFICEEIKTKQLQKIMEDIKKQIPLEEEGVSIMIYEDKTKST